MVKKRRNKKFWTGIYSTLFGSVALGLSYIGYNIFPQNSWIGNMIQEVGALGIPIVIIGLGLIIFNRNVADVVE